MRALEILSLSVLAATLVAIPMTWSKRLRLLRFLLILPATAMLLQVIIEGYRWQMVPAYALSVLLFLAGLLMFLRVPQPLGSIRWRRISNVVMIAASFAGLAIV